MKGKISRMIMKDGHELNYTFIKGEDGKEYFLHKNEMTNEDDWYELSALASANHQITVEFSPNDSAKGLRAADCAVVR